jgi:hypothetical protein
MVAGIAPDSRTSDSQSRAVSTLCGDGNPCAMTVDSSATTPWLALTAASTAGAIETTSLKNDICSLMLTGAQA